MYNNINIIINIMSDETNINVASNIFKYLIKSKTTNSN